MRRTLLLAASITAVCACGPYVIDCLASALGRAVTGKQIVNSGREGAWLLDGGALAVAAPSQGARLVLLFEGSISAGDLPRQVSARDCSVMDTAFYGSPDAGAALVRGHVDVFAGGRKVGDPLDVGLSRLTVDLPDGGAAPLPDQRVTYTVSF